MLQENSPGFDGKRSNELQNRNIIFGVDLPQVEGVVAAVRDDASLWDQSWN